MIVLATPDVFEESSFRSQAGEPVQAVGRGLGVHPMHLDKGSADSRGDGVGVAADVDVGLLVRNEIPDLIRTLHDRVLYVASRRIPLPREDGIDPDYAVSLEGAQLVFVEIVILGRPTAEEEQRGGDRYSLGLERGPLLEEAAERCQPSAGSDHDHRYVRVLR